MNIIYNDTKKDLPSEQLYKLFVAVGWSGTSDTPDMIKNYNIPFINSTLCNFSVGKRAFSWSCTGIE